MKADVKRVVAGFIGAAILLFGCKKDDPALEDAGEADPELVEILDKIPPESMTNADLIFHGGEDMIGFMMEYDRQFYSDNAWMFEEVNGKANRLEAGTGNNTLIYGAISARNKIVARLSASAKAYMNNVEGKATNAIIYETLQKSDPVQNGLWYKIGSANWREHSIPNKDFGKAQDDVDVAYHGLDCSGLLYSILRDAGFSISRLCAEDYWQYPKWENTLSGIIANEKQFDPAVYKKLKFKKYTGEEFQKQEAGVFLPGDMLFFLNGSGVAKHCGIVINGKLCQSNGTSNPKTAADNGTRSRGPHPIGVLAPIQQSGWGYRSYAVIRIVPELEDSRWQLAVRCEGQEAFITMFEITIKFDKSGKGKIEPVITTGVDYTGAECAVEFSGEYNEVTNILSGTVKKTYSVSDTRTDRFSTALKSDLMDYLPMSKVVDNGGCRNSLRLTHLDVSAINNNSNAGKAVKPEAKNNCSDSNPDYANKMN